MAPTRIFADDDMSSIGLSVNYNEDDEDTVSLGTFYTSGGERRSRRNAHL